jgi:hypothetical protein
MSKKEKTSPHGCFFCDAKMDKTIYHCQSFYY